MQRPTHLNIFWEQKLKSAHTGIALGNATSAKRDRPPRVVFDKDPESADERWKTKQGLDQDVLSSHEILKASTKRDRSRSGG